MGSLSKKMLAVSFVFFFWGYSMTYSQNEAQLDSLWQLMEQSEEPEQVNLLGWIVRFMMLTEPEKTIPLIRRRESLAAKNNLVEDRALAIYQRANAYRRLKQYDSLGIAAEQGIRIVQELEIDSLLAQFYIIKGSQQEKIGHLDSAIYYYELAMPVTREKDLMVLYNNLAVVYISKNELHKVIEYLKLALEEATRINDINAQAVISNNMGSLWDKLEQSDKALEYCLKSIELKGQLGDERGKLYAYNNIVNLYPNLHTLEEVKTYLVEAKNIADKIGDPYFKNLFRVAEAKIYVNSGDPEKAIALVQPLFDEQHDNIPYFKNRAASILMNAYIQLKQYDKAEYYALILEKDATVTNSTGQIQQARKGRVDIYKATNRYRNYFEVATQFYTLEDSIKKVRNFNKLAAMDAELKDLEKEKEIALLNATLEQRAARRNLIIAIGSLLMIILSLIIFFRSRQLSIQKRLVEQEQTTARELAKVNEELTALDLMKTRFFTNISHELRTPVTLISTPISYILKQYGASFQQEVKKSLELAKKNARQLQNLVEELLELSRIDAGKIELKPSPTTVRYFRGLYSAYESVAEHKEVAYRFNHNMETEEVILLDKKRVAKIINNLISNALKFTPEGGAVTMDVQLKPVDNQKQLTVSITDTGRGIPSEDLPFVFDRYFQTKRKDIPTDGGTGIGLAFSKELSNLMDGQLVVESKLNEGSTFIFSILVDGLSTPIVEGNLASFSEGQTIIAQPVSGVDVTPIDDSPKPKLLLVEDNPDMQELITSILATSFECEIANNGKEAWEMMQNDPNNSMGISAIISDVMMPEMDGYTLLDLVKKDTHWSQLPMVMLTARAAEEDKLKALRMGVDDYLIKPFSSEELLARVANLIQNYEQRQEFKALGIQLEFGSAISAEQEWLKTLETNCLEAIDKKLNLSASYLSDLMAISERQLLRRTKSLTGLSTKQYIQEIKLQKAKHLLENKVFDTVAEVAYACDFNAPGYFTKVFQKQFGKKPSEYLG